MYQTSIQSSRETMYETDSPGLPPSSPDVLDDGAFPCKGCGDILEEGKAFELAGNRWHIDCFRCNTCGTLLDSDANLLLLGDGSLICNNCTYSCNACGNKIEDLAILTGDQAFCAGCFRCRNCKRKIENLRYARTSQGIFCMSCHESLMARRRKRSKNQPSKTGSNLALDKALPVPPPEGSDASMTETPTELSPRFRLGPSRNPSSTGLPQSRTTGNSSPGSSHTPSSIPPRVTPYGSQTSISYQEQNEKESPLPPLQESVLRNGSKSSNKNKRQSMYSHISETTEVSNDSYGSYFPLVLDEGPPVSLPSTVSKDSQLDSEFVKEHKSDAEFERRLEEDNLRKMMQDRENQEIERRLEADRQKTANMIIEAERLKEQKEIDRRNRQLELEMARERKQEQILLRQHEAELEKEREKERQRIIRERAIEIKSDVTSSGRTSRESDRRQPIRSQNRSLQSSPRSDKHSFDVDRREMPTQNGVDGQEKIILPSIRPVIERKEVPNHINNNTPDIVEKPEQAPLIVATSNVDKLDFKLQEVPRTKRATPKLPVEADEEESTSDHASIDEIPLVLSPEPILEQPHVRSQSLPRASRVYEDTLDIKPEIPPRKSVDAPAKSFSVPNSEHPTKSHPTSRAGSSDTGLGIDGNLGSEFSAASATTTATSAYSGIDIEKESGPASVATSPPFPPRAFHRPNASRSSNNGLVTSEAAPPNGPSPVLPPFRPNIDMSFEEEMRKIFGSEASATMLRRVSNAVKHGRSYSDIASSRGTLTSPKWPRSPSLGNAPFVLPYGVDISLASPINSVDPKEENAVLKNALRRSTQHIAELESKLNNSSDMKDLDEHIQEKKSTVALLETQREQTILELSVLRERMTNVDEGAFDINEFKSEIIKGLAKELEDLKASFAPQIEMLIIQRNQLLEETAALCHKRDQAIQETEQLNSKNMQLADLNNELTRRIQGVYSSNKNDNMPDTPRMNGLGIFTNQQLAENSPEMLKEIMNQHQQRPTTSQQSMGSLNNLAGQIQEHPMAEDSGTVLTAQHVVGIRKPGSQAKKFNWKKGGAAVGKGVGKAFNKVFASDQPNQNDMYIEGSTVAYAQPYGNSPYGPTPALGSESTLRSNSQDNAYGQGVFNTQRGGGLLKKLKANNHSSLTADKDGVVPLLGSELEARVEYEGRRIPLIVTKCLEEVEQRGLDTEGIYRKGGGASQMRMIQEAFDRGEEIDLEDPSIDICAVTSVLKQYFRKLPTPLVTYNVYDGMIESAKEHDEEKRRTLVKGLINELPSLNRDILFFIINHLTKVVGYQAQNLMTSRNLAVVFAPTLMRDVTGEFELRDTHAKNETVQFIIDNAKAIFAGVDL